LPTITGCCVRKGFTFTGASSRSALSAPNLSISFCMLSSALKLAAWLQLTKCNTVTMSSNDQGRGVKPAKLEFQRVVVGMAFDVGIHAFEVPRQKITRLRRQQLGMALGIAAQAQQADLPVAGQAAWAHRFGQAPGGDGAIALDLEQPALRDDEALRANQVRRVGCKDVRDAVLVAVHTHRRAQTRQCQLAVDLGPTQVADEGRRGQRGGSQRQRHRGPQEALGKRAVQGSLLCSPVIRGRRLCRAQRGCFSVCEGSSPNWRR
jgi:hypothetical protein